MSQISILPTALSGVSIGPLEVREAEREYCARSLSHFIRRAWHVVEPAQAYIHGWHIDAIAEHLTAVTEGEITRLAIAVPPGMMKSLSVSVFWPAWEWGPLDKAHLRTVAASHNEKLAARDNLRSKRMIESDWYQFLWGDRVKLARDQSAKLKFETTRTGFRQACPFTSLTGNRGDRVILDDVMSVKDATSEAALNELHETFTEAVPLRLNDPQKSAIVVIMQRLHQNDVIGIIESEDYGYDKLILPMEYEAETKCYTSIGFKDPRTEEGELLFPERFPQEVVDRDKKILGEYAVASQFQQRPTPRSGGLFKVDQLNYVDELPLGHRYIICRGWDLAATTAKTNKRAAYAAGVKLAVSLDDLKWYVLHVKRGRFGPGELRTKIETVAGEDGYEVMIRIPQDPGQAGKVQIKDIISHLPGYNARGELQTGSKETRADAFASQVENGNVYIVNGPWVNDYVEELRFFPFSKYKDQVDASSTAFNTLAPKVRTKMPTLTITGERQENWTSRLR